VLYKTYKAKTAGIQNKGQGALDEKDQDNKLSATGKPSLTKFNY